MREYLRHGQKMNRSERVRESVWYHSHWLQVIRDP